MMLVVADWLLPVPRPVVGLYQKRLFGQKKEREKEQLGIMCGDMVVCVPYSLCQVAGA